MKGTPGACRKEKASPNTNYLAYYNPAHELTSLVSYIKCQSDSENFLLPGVVLLHWDDVPAEIGFPVHLHQELLDVDDEHARINDLLKVDHGFWKFSFVPLQFQLVPGKQGNKTLFDLQRTSRRVRQLLHISCERRL